MHNPDLFPSAAASTKAADGEVSPHDEHDGAIDGAMDGPAVSHEEIPDKLYFRIGEVARLAGIKPYVLRFWETEFPSLGPKKSGTGHRLYRRKDVQTVLDIKILLYEKRFTIEGARKHIEKQSKMETAVTPGTKRSKSAAAKPVKEQAGLFDVPSSAFDAVRKELTDILRLLS
jgi:DNA-binding transcriptional MerR regulator